jgi:hypothetical protein
MSNESTVHILNDLLEAEYSTLSQHLAESSPFVSMQSAEDQALLKRIGADAKEHEQALADLIFRLRGTPRPPRMPTELGGIHYLTLSYLMPQIVAGLKALVRKYESASSCGNPEADALISRIGSKYRKQLGELEARHQQLAAAAH